MEQESLEQKIGIGTSGWSYPTGPGKWTGMFYPPILHGGARALCGEAKGDSP